MTMNTDDIQEYYVLKNGRQIEDIKVSDKMYHLVEIAPEQNQEKQTNYTWDEAGMAEVFGQLYAEDTRYCAEYKSWFTYDSGKWKRDTQGLLLSQKVKEFVDLLILYCYELKDDEKKTAFLKFVAKMGDRRFRDRLMKDAMDVLSISALEFDTNPYLINCKNGTFDLQKKCFREHRWKDFITKQTNFAYTWSWNENSVVEDPYLTSERFEQFIAEITSDKVNGTYKPNPDKADYLQRALGYSLLGTSREECMFILHGKTTRNGKSTLLDAIEHLLGDYSSTAPVALICKSNLSKNAEAPSPVLAGLKGKRFVTMAESQESGNLDESMIKQLTGGEEITARELRQEPITFLPQFTLWLSCNSLPAVRDKSLFASDRLRVVEFNRHFGNDERDTGLKELFRKQETMEGIFTWLIRGYYKYLKRGLKMNKEMSEIINQYVKDNDIVLQFLEEKCEKDSSSLIKLKTLYDAYKTWCRSNNFHICSSKTFKKELDTHPEWCENSYVSGGTITIKGSKIKEIE